MNKCWIWLLLFLGSSLTAVSQEKVTPVMSQVGTIDLCGGDKGKQVIVTLGIGTVSKKDSLYGFDFQISYDPNKIWFHTALYINTLSEFFDLRDVTFGADSGKISGYATTFNFSMPPVSGNRPLIGFLGEYLGECPDSTALKLDYLEFTTEYKKVADTAKDLKIDAAIADLPDRILSTVLSSDTLNFENNAEDTIKIKFGYKPDSRLTDIEFKITVCNSEQFNIKDVLSVNNHFVIKEITPDTNGFRIKVGLISPALTDEWALFSVIEGKIKKNETCLLSIDSLKINDCTCIKHVTGNNALLIGTWKDTTDTSSVIIEPIVSDRRIKAYYSDAGDEFVFERSETGKIEVNIYDINGSLVKYKGSEDQVVRMNAEKLPQGIYFAVIKKNDIVIKKLVLIKIR